MSTDRFFTAGRLEVDTNFDSERELEVIMNDCGYESRDYSEWLTVNQVKNLMSHLQRALDEHGGRTQ